MADAQIKVGIKSDQTQFVAGTKKAGEAIDTLKKKADEYNRGFEDAAKQSQREIDRLTARLEKAGDATGGFGDILKSVAGGAVAGFAAGLVSADTVVAGFQKAISSTQTTADAFDIAVAGMQAGVEEFFSSLTTGSFDTFIDGIQRAVTEGRKLASLLDSIADMEWAGDISRKELTTKINKAKAVINSDKATPTEKEEAKKQLNWYINKYRTEAGATIEALKEATYTAYAKSSPNAKASREDFMAYVETQKRGTDTRYNQYKELYEGIKSAETVTTFVAGGAGAISRTVATLTKNGEARLKELRDKYPYLERLRKVDDTITDKEREQIGEIWNKMQFLEADIESIAVQSVRLDNRVGRAAVRGGKSGGGSRQAKADFWDSVKAPDARELGLDKPMVAPIRAALIVAPEVIKRLEDERRSLVEQLNGTADPDARVKLKAEISGVEGKLGQVKELTRVDGLKLPEPLDTSGWNFDGLDKAVGTFGDLANVMDLVTGSSDNALSSVLRWGAGIVSAIGQAIPSILALTAASKAKATAQAEDAVTGAAASQAAIPFAGPLMAAAAIASVVAAIASAPKFAGGGIVPGSSFGGDKILARLNSGEMVLNKEQQARLFSKLERPDSPGGGGRVEFKIKGEELVGVLDRFGRRSSRT